MSMRSKHTKVAIVDFLHVITPGREGKPLNSDPPAPLITDSTLDNCSGAVRPSAASDARSWARVLARYREPNDARSIVEIVITLGPLVALWALAWTTYRVGLWRLLTLQPARHLRWFTANLACTMPSTPKLSTPARRRNMSLIHIEWCRMICRPGAISSAHA